MVCSNACGTFGRRDFCLRATCPASVFNSLTPERARARHEAHSSPVVKRMTIESPGCAYLCWTLVQCDIMSALGQKQTCAVQLGMSAFGPTPGRLFDPLVSG